MTRTSLGQTESDDIDGAIADEARAFIADGATLQIGIGAVPNMVARQLATGPGFNYGIHSEMFTDGLMELHQAGKVSNDAKGLFSGVSVTTFALGSSELYQWLDGNDQVAFVPVEVVNDPSVIAANHTFVSINGALSVDLYGQVVADSIDGKQVSGVGGHEDFVAGAELRDRRPLADLPPLDRRGRRDHQVAHRSLPARGIGGLHPAPPHRGDHHRVRCRRPCRAGPFGKGPPPLVEIAHPDFRDELRSVAGGLGRH